MKSGVHFCFSFILFDFLTLLSCFLSLTTPAWGLVITFLRQTSSKVQACVNYCICQEWTQSDGVASTNDCIRPGVTQSYVNGRRLRTNPCLTRWSITRTGSTTLSSVNGATISSPPQMTSHSRCGVPRKAAACRHCERIKTMSGLFLPIISSRQCVKVVWPIQPNGTKSSRVASTIKSTCGICKHWRPLQLKTRPSHAPISVAPIIRFTQ